MTLIINAKKSKRAAYKALQEKGEPSESAQEFAERARAGEFDKLGELADSELLALQKDANAMADELSWHKQTHADDYGTCCSLLSAVESERRDRTLKREDHAQEQRKRKKAILDGAAAMSKLAEAVSVPYDREWNEGRNKHFTLTPEAARALDGEGLSRIIRETGGMEATNCKNELKGLDRAIKGLECAQGWDVAEKALADVTSHRDSVAAKLEAIQKSAEVARSEIERRAAEQAERERLEQSLPEVVKQLQERVETLEASN